MATINLGRIKPVFKGAYASGTAYVVDDIVVYSDESYICIQAGTGKTPSSETAYWTKMAAKGTNGTNGTDLSTTLTTRGDIVYKGASALTRLPKGTNGYFLKQGANDPEWGAVDLTNLSASNLSSGTIPNARYGTPTFNGSNLTNLPASGKVLQAVRSLNPGVVSSSNNLGGKDFANNKAVGNGAQICTINVTPISTTSHLYAWYSCAHGVGNNAVSVVGLFFNSERRNLGSANSYANDVGGINVHAIFDVPSSSQIQVQARNLGSHNGGTNYTNADQSGNSNGGIATLTVMEIQD